MPTDTSAIERFIAMVKSESKLQGGKASNTVWVRMTLVEAQALTSEIAVVMSRLTRLENDGATLTATADGGTLR